MAELCASWATVADLIAPCSPDDVIDATEFTAALRLASTVLFNFTRQKWPGVCTDTFRPCADSCLYYRQWRGTGFYPMPYDRTVCGCGGGDLLVLPGYPVTALTRVTIDGFDEALSQFRVDNGNVLVTVRAVDGDPVLMFPGCQRMDLPVTEDGTWEIEYSFGAAPPPEGRRMAAILGCELARSCAPPGSAQSSACRLPKRVTSITRAGVTMALIDPLDLFDKGKTGLPEVDLWVSSVLYGDRYAPAAVYDPNKFQTRTRRSL
jgi:hypothetical protein